MGLREEREPSTVIEFVQGFLDRKAEKGSAASTVERYRVVLDRFVESMGRRAKGPLAGVTLADLERFRQKEMDEGRSASSATVNVKIVGAVLNDGVRRGVLLSSPHRQLSPLNDAEGKEREPFTDEEIRALLAVAGDTWRGMILFGAWCGLRLADAANLTWSNINLANRVLTFEPAKTRNTKKRNNKVSIPLPNELVLWLKGRPEGINEAPIFPELHGHRSGSGSKPSKQFFRLMLKAGLDCGFSGELVEGSKGRRFRPKSYHSLRHSMISRLANANIGADVRRSMVGHSSDAIHSRYVHLDASTQREAMDSLPAFSHE